MARVLELIENESSINKKAQIISENLSSFKDKESFLRILCEDYGPCNIGEKRAIAWLASIYGVHDEEIEQCAYEWGDLGEGIKQFLPLDFAATSPHSLQSILGLLNMNCSSINSDTHTLYREVLHEFSALEVKWFVRYWLNKPRNGCGTRLVERAMIQRYGLEMREQLKYRNAIELVSYAEKGDGWVENLPTINWIGRFIKPMLAKKLTNNLPENYIVDIKYDGNRYQIHHNGTTPDKTLDSQRTIIFNRKGKIVTDYFPDIVDIFKDCEDDIIIDTEIYPINEDGSPAEHQKMGTRVHSKDKAKAVEECKVKLVVFDLMYANSKLLIGYSYRTRLSILKELVYMTNHLAKELPLDIESSYNVAINAGFEGIMIKNLDAIYESKRSSALLKHKPARIELDVVILSAKYGSGKRTDVFGTYGIGVVSEDGYTSIGSVGTGLSDADLRMLTTQLKRIVERFESDTFYVLPRIVLEVTADLVSQERNGNYGLRFPRVHRIRHDKYPVDCNTIEDVMELA
jgi:DNA ligase-1